MSSAVHTLPFSCRSLSGAWPSHRASPRSRWRGPARAEQNREDKNSSKLKAGGDDTWRRASLTELEQEFGIKPKDPKKSKVRSDGSSRPPRNLSPEEWKEINEKWDDLEREALGMDPEKVNKLALTLQEWGQWLLDKTKEADDSDPRNVATGLLLIFSVWFFLLLVYAGVIEVPIQLPFLES